MLTLLMFLAAQRNAEPLHITVDTPTVQGEYYAPAIGTDRKPGILVVHGSEGSTQFTSYAAMELARAGYPSLAVRYFGGKGQPVHLIKLPLETLEAGLKWLKSQTRVDSKRITLLGYSRGAEAVLDFAALGQPASAVVAVAPTCMRFQGFISMTEPVTDAAFTWRGKPLPFTSLEFSSGPAATVYSKALADPKNTSAYIELERSRAPIMLISGQSDVVWPSSMLAGKVVERLKAKKFRHELLWKDYANAGHILLAPNYKPREKPPVQYGGTADGVNHALTDAWPAMMNFLARANR